MATLTLTFRLWLKRASSMELGTALEAITEEIAERTEAECKHRASHGRFALKKPIEQGPDQPHQHAE